MINITNKRAASDAAGKHRLKPAMLAAALVLSFIYAAAFTDNICKAAAAGQSDQKTPVQTEFSRLEGRWIRPDGGYVLELRNIRKDGSASAAYFNPRPINVFRAEVSRKEGDIRLFVELRDVNYPGSTYTLQYDAAADLLKGAYFQAVQGQTFEIVFERVK